MRIAFLGLFLTASSTVAAQFYIGTGAQVQFTGNVQVTLNDADLVNHGTLAPGNSTVYFTGSGQFHYRRYRARSALYPTP